MKIKSAKSYNMKWKTITSIYLLIWFIVLIVISEFIKNTPSFPPALLEIISFIILIAFLFKAYKKHHEPFKCPDCGKIIESSLENSDADSEAIIYHCSHCETLWHVGDTES